MYQKMITAVSTGSDREGVAAFLDTVAEAGMRGFGKAEATIIIDEVDRFEMDEQKKWNFDLTSATGGSHRLSIFIFKDDEDALDIDVETSDPVLADRLKQTLLRLYPDLA